MSAHRIPRLLALAVGAAFLLLVLAVLPAAAAGPDTPTDLFFSEYIEGSSNNKALEIYNGTGAAVDMAAGNYIIEYYNNGSPTPTNSYSLTATVADGDVYVLAADQADAAILAQADVALAFPSVVHFNGDDALVLKHDGAIIDSIGRVGEDPGSFWGTGDVTTQDHTLRRKCGIEAGDSDPSDAFDPATEWDGYPINTFDGLGGHSTVCPPAVGDPNIVKTGPAYVMAAQGQELVYTITISNPAASDATGVVITDELPADTSYVGDNIGAPANPSAGVYVWSVTDVPAGSKVSYNLTVTLDITPTSGAVLTNTVTLSTTLGGDDPGNNQAAWETAAYPLVTIYDVQTVPDPAASDASPYAGQVVFVEGVVTAQPGEIDTPSRMMVIQDPAGGPWSGLPVFRSGNFGGLVAPEGTQVRVLGTMTEYNGLTEMNLSSGPWSVEVLGSQAPLSPQILATGGFDDADASVSEQWEGVYIEFQDATVTNDNLGFGEWYFDDGSGNTRADDLGAGDGNLNYDPSNGDRYIFIRGIGWFSFGNYKLAPRYDADIEQAADEPRINKDAPAVVGLGELITYTISVENQLGYTLNDVVVSDMVPAGATFAYALDGGSEAGGLVTWNVGTLASPGSVSLRFAVTAPAQSGVVVNTDYEVAASNFTTPTAGSPLVTVVSDNGLRIHHIQGAAHVSPLLSQFVVDVPGEVIAVSGNGFWMQDPLPDAADATSEGIFVYTGGAPGVSIGDSLLVDGTVAEFYPGGIAAGNLPTTELTGVTVDVVAPPKQALAITPTVIGIGGRIPPNAVIEDDVAGNVESSGVFDPDSDGLDFYESLEGMLLQVNGAVAVGPTNRFGEIPLVSDGGANASVRTNRDGIVIQTTDYNPERIITDDILQPSVTVNTGDSFGGPVIGVLDYSFGNFKLLSIDPLPAVVSGGLAQETANPPVAHQVTVATFNVENLSAAAPASKFQALADIIVNRMLAPDIIVLEEIQDNNGETDNSVVDATDTYNALIAAITTAGGPTYQFRDIAPQNNQDGGAPGANIRVGFLFRTDTGISFADRPGGSASAATQPVLGVQGLQLTLSPGRVDPTNIAFDDSRKPLAGEFQCGGEPLIIVGNHFNSKGGDNPLFGRIQPPVLSSEVQRLQQAQVVNDFVDGILALDPQARVIVLGDLNDFQFSPPIQTLKGGVLTNLIDTLPLAEQYTYIYDGNSQVLDQILVTDGIFSRGTDVDVVHVDAEFDANSRVSDHDPVLLRFTCALPTAVELSGFDAALSRPAPAPLAGLPWQMVVGAAAVAMGFIAARRRAA